MDEYKEYYYIREPQIRKLDFGDVSEQKAIRDKLQCKPFKWFMEKIAYDLVKKFPLPPKNKVWGEVISFCLLLFFYLFPNCKHKYQLNRKKNNLSSK